MINSNIHTHTVFSDGKNSAEENIAAALELGMDTLGFSDHSFTPCARSYCMKENAVAEYKNTVTDLKEKYAGKINVLCGIEFDYYSNPQMLAGLDYFIGASHYVKSNGIYYAVDHSAEDTKKCINEGFAGSQSLYAKSYFDNIVSCAKLKPLYMAHFDLPVKSGVIDENSNAYRDIVLSAANAVINLGVPFEVNTGAMARGIKKVPYPSDFVIRYINEHGGKFMLGSDSHYKEKLLFAFDGTLEFLKNCDVKSLLVFKNGKIAEQGI